MGVVDVDFVSRAFHCPGFVLFDTVYTLFVVGFCSCGSFCTLMILLFVGMIILNMRPWAVPSFVFVASALVHVRAAYKTVGDTEATKSRSLCRHSVCMGSCQCGDLSEVFDVSVQSQDFDISPLYFDRVLTASGLVFLLRLHKTCVFVVCR